MVVHPINGVVPSTPLRAAASTFSLAARMKRGGGARRALTSLGNNDTQNNLRLAESLLTVSQEKFAKKWNFDPVKVEPLAPGRYLWSPVTSNITHAPTEPKGMAPVATSKDILTCFTLPKSGFRHPSDEPRVPDLHGVEENVVSDDKVTESPNSSIDSGIVSDESLSESPTVPARSSSSNTTQTTITDYLRCSKKRLLVVGDDMELSSPASKRQHRQEGGHSSCPPPAAAHNTTTTGGATSLPAGEPAAAAASASALIHK